MAIVTKSIIAGGGGDYTTIDGWEGDVGNYGTDTYKGEIQDNSLYTASNISLAGGTGAPSSTSYLWLTVASGNRHSGVAGTGHARVESTLSTHAFTIQNDYVRVEWLEIFSKSTGSSDEAFRIGGDYDNILISHCIIYSTTTTADKDGIYIGQNSVTLSVDNCIFYGWARAAIHIQHHGTGTRTTTIDIDCNTFWENGAVSEDESGALFVRTDDANDTVTINAYNNIGYLEAGTYEAFADGDGGSRNAPSGTVTWNGSHNLRGDQTAGVEIDGTDNTTNWQGASDGDADTTQSSGSYVVFSDIDSPYDFTLLDDAAGNLAAGNGTNRQGSEPDSRQDFSVDITGGSRPTSGVDIGAHQVSGGSAVTIESTEAEFAFDTGTTDLTLVAKTIESTEAEFTFDTGTTSVDASQPITIESTEAEFAFDTGTTSIDAGGVVVESTEAEFAFDTGNTTVVRGGTSTSLTTPFYEAVIVDRIVAQSAAPTFQEVDRIKILDRVVWSKELNGDGFAAVSTRPDRLESALQTRLRAPDENPMELWIYRNGTQVYAGPIIGIQVQGTNKTITLHSRGLLYYLRWMFLTTDYAATATDKFTVVKALVDHWQNLDYGDFGIDTSGIGASGDTIDVDYKRTEIVNIAQAVSQLSNPDAANGFDFAIDPITRDLVLYDPQRGTDKSSSVILDNRVLQEYSMFMDMTAGDFGTTVVGSGTGFQLDGALWSQAINTTRRAQFGLAGLGAQWNNIVSQTTLDDYVNSLRDVHSNFAISFGGSGGTEEGGTTRIVPVVGFEYDDIDPGDTIAVTADLGFGEFNLQRDVSGVVVSQGADGTEEISLGII